MKLDVERCSQLNEAAAMAEGPEDLDRTNAPQPKLRQRKSSFSDALSKFTSKTFSRRDTPAGFPTSVSTVSMHKQSRLPTPSGIPKSSSFFSSLNSFATKSTSSSVSRSETSQPPPIKRPRKISERLASTPFFSLSNQQQRVPTAPILTNPIHRETTVKIETRGLMQPVAPPLPRSSTIANLATIYSSPQTPGYMRPTSSSAARRGSLAGSKQVNTPMPTITSRQPPVDSPTHRRRTPSSRFPVRKDSLPPAPTSKSVKTGRRYSMLPTPVPQNRNPVHEDTLVSPPRRSSMKRRQLLRESETLPNMTARISGGQDSGVAFERDDEVQRRFDQYNTTMDLSSIDQTKPISLITSTDETEDATASESNEDTVLHRTCDRAPIPDPSNPRQIHDPKSPLYWLGRYTALSDRFRTSALPCQSSSTSNFSTPSPSPTSSAHDSLHHPMHDEARRNRRIFIHLRGLCVNDAARDSLEEFKTFWEERQRKIRDGEGRVGAKIREKKGWLEGLMGRGKK